MPFKALRDGEPVISLAFSDRSWREEKERQRAGEVAYACPGCGAPVALATSPRGRPFFKHFPNSDCPNSRPKSEEHERLQVEVYQLCTGRGWATDIEARGPGGDWTADVLAAKDGERYAFEVQLAPIAGEALEARSARYRDAGIVPVWLLRKFPARCPFTVPSQTFVTAWARRAEPSLSDDLHPLRLRDEEVDRCFLDAVTVAWSLDPVLVWWRELGAVLAVFDAAGPDRLLLGDRAVRLPGLVGMTLDGKVRDGFAAAIGQAYDRHYELVEAGRIAEIGHARLLGEVRQELGALAWERARRQSPAPARNRKRGGRTRGA